MKIIDKAAIDEARKRTHCEWCSKRFGPGDIRDVHHVRKRSLDRLDTAALLMCVHRFPCHAELDTTEGYRKCIGIIAKKERCTVEDVEAVIRFFSLMPKGMSNEQIADAALSDNFLGIRAYLLVLRTLNSMPDQTPVQKPLRKKAKRKSALKERAKAARKARYQSAKAWKAAR